MASTSEILCGTNGVFELSALNGLNGFTLNGEAASDLSGNTVKAIGDINHDGFKDFIIGAIAAESLNGYQSGKAYVVFGSNNLGWSGKLMLSSLNGVNGFKINGLAAYNWLGYSSAALGDINHDGIDDFVVGASGADVTGIESGSCYVIFGKVDIGSSGTVDLSTLDGSNGFSIHGKFAGDEFGRALSSAGDFNNDGIKDIAIGALYADTNGDNSGASYVIYGTSTIGRGGVFDLNSLDGSNGFEIRGVQSGDQSGSAISSAGDINHDGYDDIMVKSFRPGTKNINDLYAGVVYFIYGGKSVETNGVFELTDINGNNGFVVTGLSYSSNSGSTVVASLSMAFDVNNDGIDDVILGSIYSSTNGALSGASYVLFGSNSIGMRGLLDVSELNGSNGFVINGVAAGDNSGISVSAEDINNDGISDLIIGAWHASSHVSNSGSCYIVYGSNIIGARGVFQLSNLNGNNGFKINGLASGDAFGMAVSGIGDVNNDGWNDFIVGAYFADANGLTNTGASYVIYCASQIFPHPSRIPSAVPTLSLSVNPSFRLSYAPSKFLSVAPTATLFKKSENFSNGSQDNLSLYYFLLIGMPILGSVLAGLITNYIWTTFCENKQQTVYASAPMHQV